MKKFFAIFVAFVFGFSALSTAQSKSIGKNDPDAKKLLDLVSANFKKNSSLTAKVNLRSENSNGTSLGTKAGTIFMKGTKYKIVMPGQEIFSDGSNVWTYDKNANEVTITKFDENSNTLTPQKLFTNFYDDEYLYKMNPDAKVGNITYKEVELTPNDKTSPFYKVLLNIRNNAISKAKIFEKSGNRYTYSILSTSKVALSESTFIFNPSKYPGVEVVDLR